MPRSAVGALRMALVGGLSGIAWLTLVLAWAPDVNFNMDRDQPGVMSGFYPVERNGDETFAWTRARADVRLAGLDRRSPWQCVVRVRGGRSDGIPQPVVEIAADGVVLVRRTATNEYQELIVAIPARPNASGLTLSIASSETVVPGPSDPRQLGIQINSISFRPATRFVLPPRRAVVPAFLAGAMFGAAFGAILPTSGALPGTMALTAGAAIPLATTAGPFSPRYQRDVVHAAAWIAIAMFVFVVGGDRTRRDPMSVAARLVIAFSAGALFLDLLALLHPAKQPVDAVFQAHRFEWVLSGRYYFTQATRDTQFPYAIALYLFAAPWSILTRDHVSLLRIVVCSTHIVAGASMYPMVVRTWGDRSTGVASVVLYHLIPLPYVVIGNANLTYAFGQAVSTIALAVMAIWPLRIRQVGRLIAFFTLASVAFLSHIWVFPALLAALVVIAVLFRTFGGRELHGAGWTAGVTALIAAVFSIAIYYGHFPEAYRTLTRVRSQPSQVATPAESPPSTPPAPQRQDTVPRTLPVRLSRVAALAVTDLGWPIVLLAVLGATPVWREGIRNRLGLVLAGIGLAFVGALAIVVATPVEPAFQRYIDEFVDRQIFFVVPAAAILAGRGATWGWRAGIGPRIVCAALLLLAAIGGFEQWRTWLA